MMHNIVLVDDHAPALRALSLAVSRICREQASFSSPQAAMEAILSAPSKWDTVISDYGMAEMTGTEFARLLRESGFEGRFILLSGNLLQAKTEDHSAVDVLLEKPLNLFSLKEAIS